MTTRGVVLPIVSKRGGEIFPASSLTVVPSMGAPKIHAGAHIQGHVFANGAEFCEAIPEGGGARAWHQGTWATDKGREEFTGTRSMHAAKALFSAPPQSLRDKAESAAQSLAPIAPMRHKLHSWNIAGAYPSVGRALSGEPRAMRAVSWQKSPKMVTLICNVVIPWNIKASVLIDFSAAMGATIDRLEDSGWRVEVWAAQIAISDSDFVGGSLVRLKASEDSTDMAKLVAGLGHPSFLRRLCFGYASVTSALKPLGDAMGYSAEILPPDDVSGVYCTSLSAAYETITDAKRKPTAQNFLAEIAATLGRQGFAGFSEEP